jgi:hypothetical protein
MTTTISGNPQELFAALAKARAEFRPIRKTREVKVQSDRGSYTFSYAELDELIDATVPALAANGLAVFHTRSTDSPENASERPERELVTHFLAHSSGAYLKCEQAIPMTKIAWEGPQGQKVRTERRLTEQEFGSAFTYARRYAYQALLNLAAEDDDDANQADGNRVEERRDRRQAPTPRPEPKASPAVSQRPPTIPPPRMVPADHPLGQPQGPISEALQQEQEEDTRPAQSDEKLDKDLAAAFAHLRKEWSPPSLNAWARKITGKVPSAWNVSDGRKFLAEYLAGGRPQ